MESDTLKVSSIFEWYHQDFERGWSGFKELSQFFTAYKQALGLSEGDVRRLKSGEINIEFRGYDWRLNRTP